MADETVRNAAADGAGTNLEGTFYALHSDATSGSQVSNERVAPVYDPATGSAAALNATLSFTGTPSQAVSHLGVWTLASGGSFRFSEPLTGDLAFNASGDLSLVAAPVTLADA